MAINWDEGKSAQQHRRAPARSIPIPSSASLGITAAVLGKVGGVYLRRVWGRGCLPGGPGVQSQGGGFKEGGFLTARKQEPCLCGAGALGPGAEGLL